METDDEDDKDYSKPLQIKRPTQNKSTPKYSFTKIPFHQIPAVVAATSISTSSSSSSIPMVTSIPTFSQQRDQALTKTIVKSKSKSSSVTGIIIKPTVVWKMVDDVSKQHVTISDRICCTILEETFRSSNRYDCFVVINGKNYLVNMDATVFKWIAIAIADNSTPFYLYRYETHVVDKYSSPIRRGPVNLNSKDDDHIKQQQNEGEENEEEEEDCAICLTTLDASKFITECNHVFHKSCLYSWFEKAGTCPLCKSTLIESIGKQTDGKLTIHAKHMSLSGYPSKGTFTLQFDMFSGVQDHRHDNPGMNFHADMREAYLPIVPETFDTLQLFIKAFYYRKIFSIGLSISRGVGNVITYGSVHLKTELTGPHGYPDATYLNRVMDELKQVLL